MSLLVGQPNSAERVVGTAPLSEPERDAPPRKHIKSLTALRFFPAFAVVLFHSGEHFTCLGAIKDQFVVTQVMAFFFVLSGFILTLNYFHLSDVRSACSFYLARFARIWPAHVACLLLLVFMIPETFKLTSFTYPMFWTNLTLTHGWIPSWKYFFSFNAPSWSNSTEMFFYVCFPFLLLGLKSRRWFLVPAVVGACLITMIGVCTLLRLPEFDPNGLSNQALLYVNPLTRVFEFTVGMAAAFLIGRLSRKGSLTPQWATFLEVCAVGGLLLLNIFSPTIRVHAAPLIGEAGAYWLQNSGIPVFGMAALFMILSTEKGRLSKILSFPFLVFLGELSFAMYMLHCVFLAYRGINFPFANSTSDFVIFLASLFVAAHLLWLGVEMPVRKAILSVGEIWLKKKSHTKSTLPAMPHRFGFKHLLLVCEIALLGCLLYFSLPTLNRIPSTAAASLQTQASITDIEYGQDLRLHSGNASVSAGGVLVNLVWQASKPARADYLVVADVLDSSHHVLYHVTFMQDLRRTSVSTGELWNDSFKLPVPQTAQPAYLSLKLLKSKRKPIVPRSPMSTKDGALLIPLTK